MRLEGHTMFKNDTVSRRNVLKTTGGLVASSSALATLGTGKGAAETEEGLQIEVREITEESIAVEVRIPPRGTDNVEDAFFGHADRFVIREDTVSLPEDTESLANPVEIERLDDGTYAMYFRTEEVGLSEAEDDEVVLGLGVFPERTVSRNYWDTTSITGPWGDPY